MHFIPGLRLCVDEVTENAGIDESDMGEYAYDYVSLESEIRPFGAHLSTAVNPAEGQYIKERASSNSGHRAV